MIDFAGFIRKFSYMLAVLLAVFVGLYKLQLIEKSLFVAIITAKLLNSLNFIIGFNINIKALRKDQGLFMIYVFGGMGIRLISMLILIFICYKLLNLNFYSFILVFFGFYFFFLAIEIYYLLKFEYSKNKLND